MRNFEKKYPNIKVNYEVNYEDKVYEDILIKKIARNELGDIVQLKTHFTTFSVPTILLFADTYDEKRFPADCGAPLKFYNSQKTNFY